MRTKYLLLLICLTVSGCGERPTIPKPPIFQPIIDQELCDSNNVCQRVTICREYRVNDIGNYEMVQVHDIKKCSGILGYTSDGYLEITHALRQLKDWMITHCRNKKSIKNTSFPEMDIQ